MIGQDIAHYRITAKLGEGGMGEVYRATDLKLGRDVALKVLPPVFSDSAERMARFTREAHVLASLNHPNIAAIYGVEDHAIIMELVEGPTLADRIAQGPIPVEEALPIARQIAEALEAAHEKGIIHRDLKPANVKVTPDGQVKVLDFGLAKALDERSSSSNPATSPTLTAIAGTVAGVILGTAAYMAPEQARGASVDRRADIWAFGAVLYEMLSARQAFAGETVSDILAAVLKFEPDWTAVPAAAPMSLLRRCLTKDRKERLQAIGEARIAIDGILSGATTQTPAALPPSASRRSVLLWPALAAPAFASLSGWLWLRAPKPEPRPVMKWKADLPDPAGVAFLTLSRDGSQLAYVGSAPGVNRIMVRAMGQLESKPLSGTDGVFGITFSPDGQWIAYQVDAKLKKVPAAGGASITLCDTLSWYGVAWGEDDTIVIGNRNTGLTRISAAGGKPEPLTQLDTKGGETGHSWPFFLPGSKALLFTSNKSSYDDAELAALDLRSARRSVLWKGGSTPSYVPAGYMVFGRSASIFAIPFDAGRLAVKGTPVPVIEGVYWAAISGFSDYTFSQSGALLYMPGGVVGADRNLTLVDRKGAEKPLPAPSRAYSGLRVSPDGRRVALRVGLVQQDADIFVYDLDRGTLTRLTVEPASNKSTPVWTPDGKYLAYRTGSQGKAAMVIRPADGTGAPRELVESALAGTPSSFSPDGRTLVFTRLDNVNQLWVVDVRPDSDGPNKPRPLIQTPQGISDGQVSPDGKWLAYVTSGTGGQVLVQPFASASGGKWQISVDGGYSPRWSASGRELFYLHSGRQAGPGSKIKAFAVEIESSSSFRAGVPKLLFELDNAGRVFEPTPDGKGFLMIGSPFREPSQKGVQLVVDWFDELKRLVLVK